MTNEKLLATNDRQVLLADDRYNMILTTAINYILHQQHTNGINMIGDDNSFVDDTKAIASVAMLMNKHCSQQTTWQFDYEQLEQILAAEREEDMYQK